MPDVLLTSRACQTGFRVHVRPSHAHGLRGAEVTQRHRQGVRADDGGGAGAAGDRRKQRYSTEAGVQHGDLRDSPPGRLPEPVGGNGQQQLCPHQRRRQGLWQAEEKRPDVSAAKTFGDTRLKPDTKKTENKNQLKQNQAENKL